MAMQTLRFNTVDVERAFRQLRERAPQAIARALNRSTGSAKTTMVRVVSSDIGLKVSDVRELIGVRHATADRQVAHLTASPKRIPLIDFDARGPEPSRGRGTGVRYRLRGGKGHLPHAFIATMPNGHRGVFMRDPTKRMRGTTRPAIVEKFGPSIARVFENNVAIGIARGQEQLAKNLEHEFRFAMRAGA